MAELNLTDILQNVDDPVITGLFTFLYFQIEFEVSGDESRLHALLIADPIARALLMELCLRVTRETRKVTFAIPTDAAASSVKLFRDAFAVMKDYPDTTQVGAAGSSYHVVVFSDESSVYANVWLLP
jgi:hypothetical protein